MPLELPAQLVNSIREGRMVVFLGAGASYGAVHPTKAKVPNGNALRDALSDRYLGGKLKDRSLAEVSNYAVNESSRIDVQQFIASIFRPFGPAKFHKEFSTFSWHHIFSTNYDTIVEKAYSANGAKASQALVPVVFDNQNIDELSRQHAKPLVFVKLHGCINHSSNTDYPFILTSEQYIDFLDNRQLLFGRLKERARNSPMLFIGYKISDPNVQSVIFDFKRRDIDRQMFYCVDPGMDDIEIRYWAQHRVTAIRATFEEFLESLGEKIGYESRKLGILVDKENHPINKHFITIDASLSDELSLFLSSDFEYVHNGIPVDSVSPAEFFKGNSDSFSGILQNFDVERNVYQEIMLDFLLPDGSEDDGLRISVITGESGNGKTVLLRRLAFDIGVQFDYISLYHQFEGRFSAESVRELHSLTNRRIFLFIDKPSYFANELVGFFQKLHSYKIPVSILMSETEAEWLSRCDGLSHLVRDQFNLRYLSENEINKIIDKLNSLRCLGELAAKSREEQFRFFNEIAQRQVLVALHEALSGEKLEDILFEEYSRIPDANARQMYLDICTLNRLGVHVRAGLVARSSGIKFEEFEAKFFNPLKGIIFSEWSPYIKDHFYRARHHKVAEIVFLRVLEDVSARFDQMIRILSSINISYSSDNEAFSQIIRARTILDMFGNIKLARNFYGICYEIFGEEPFLLQQNAILETDIVSGDTEIAIDLAERALAKEPYNRGIKHTLANVLRKAGQGHSNPLIRAKHRSRARGLLSELRTNREADSRGAILALNITLDELDEQLSLFGPGAGPDQNRVLSNFVKEIEDRLIQCRSEFPADEYVREAEARYHQIMEKSQAAIDALEKALHINPMAEWIRVRLSRTLENVDEQRAQDILEEGLRRDSTSKRLNYALGKLLSQHNEHEKLRKALGHLRHSYNSNDGNVDARFHAARIHFILGEYRESDVLFSELRRMRNLNRKLHTKNSTVKDVNGKIIVYYGRISDLRDSFGFIEIAGILTRLFFHMNQLVDVDKWSSLVVGASVSCHIAFSDKGANATDVSQN